MRRFSRRISGVIFVADVFDSHASRPPFFSIVRRPLTVRRRRTAVPSTSLISEVSCRFGRKRRFVLLLAWLTLLPTNAPLPVIWQRRAMGILELSVSSGGARKEGAIYGPGSKRSSMDAAPQGSELGRSEEHTSELQ